MTRKTKLERIETDKYYDSRRLKSLRNAKGLSRTELAALTDTHENTIANYEAGTHPIPTHFRREIYMLFGEEIQPPVASSLPHVFRKLSKSRMAQAAAQCAPNNAQQKRVFSFAATLGWIRQQRSKAKYFDEQVRSPVRRVLSATLELAFYFCLANYAYEYLRRFFDMPDYYPSHYHDIILISTAFGTLFFGLMTAMNLPWEFNIKETHQNDEP